jgi:hypothetical protein
LRLRIVASFALLLAILAGAFALHWLFTRPPPAPAGAPAATVGMSIEAFDPRVEGSSGGSRGLYLDLRQSGKPLVQALQEGRGVEVWEILARNGGARHAAAFYAHFVYHGSGVAPDCVITEWGISSRALPAPRRGTAVRYAAQRGAAGAPPLFAEVKLPPELGVKPGDAGARYIPVARWSDGGTGILRIAPGKSARALLHAGAADGPVSRGVSTSPPRAVELRAYARVRIGRSSKLVESSNALYAVWVDEAGIVAADGGLEDPVENLRSLAYQPRSAAQDPAAAAQVPPAASPQPGYVVQLGAFRDEAHARTLAERVKRAGFGCTVTRIEGADGTPMYRVRLTPALSRRDAEFLSAKIGEKVSQLRPLALRADR